MERGGGFTQAPLAVAGLAWHYWGGNADRSCGWLARN